MASFLSHFNRDTVPPFLTKCKICHWSTNRRSLKHMSSHLQSDHNILFSTIMENRGKSVKIYKMEKNSTVCKPKTNSLKPQFMPINELEPYAVKFVKPEGKNHISCPPTNNVHLNVEIELDTIPKTRMSFLPFSMIDYPEEFYAEIGSDFRMFCNLLESEEEKEVKKVNTPILNHRLGVYCDICELWLKDISIFKAHLAEDVRHKKNDINRFPCPVCPRSFLKHFQIVAHINSPAHSARFGSVNIFPSCSVCLKKFRDGNSRNEHMKATKHELEVDYLDQTYVQNKVPVSEQPFWIQLRYIKETQLNNQQNRSNTCQNLVEEKSYVLPLLEQKESNSLSNNTEHLVLPSIKEKTTKLPLLKPEVFDPVAKRAVDSSQLYSTKTIATNARFSTSINYKNIDDFVLYNNLQSNEQITRLQSEKKRFANFKPWIKPNKPDYRKKTKFEFGKQKHKQDSQMEFYMQGSKSNFYNKSKLNTICKNPTAQVKGGRNILVKMKKPKRRKHFCANSKCNNN